MIDKKTIIISSLGRTGTTFFTRYFKDNFKNIACFHEPGTINYKKLNPKEMARSIKLYGFKNSILNKLLGKWDISSVSNKKLSAKISKKGAAKMIFDARKKFIEKFKEDLYIESSYHFYGVLDVIPEVFSDYKIIYFVRDPRDWVRSWINYKVLYHKSDIRYWLGNRPTPKMVGDGKYKNFWKKMDHFERLCWAWNFINGYAINSIKNDPNARLCLFEDFFAGEEKNEKMFELIKAMVDFKDIKFIPPSDLKKTIKESITTRINKPSSYDFPDWKKWSPLQAKALNEICGELMEKLGYGNENEWKQLIDS